MNNFFRLYVFSFHIYGNVCPLCPLTLTNIQALYICGPNILFKRVKMWKYLHYVVFKDVTLLLLFFFNETSLFHIRCLDAMKHVFPRTHYTVSVQ